MKALIKITLAISFSFGFLYANGNGGGQANGATSATTQAELAKIFVNPNASDAIDTTSSCEWTCRDVNLNYATQISGFDFEKGITYCRVYQKDNLDEPLVYNANKQRLSCMKNIYEKENLYPNLTNLANQKSNKIKSKIEYTPNDNEITLSQFLSSLVTLNPNIIDREATKNLGELTLKDGKNIVSTVAIQQKGTWQSVKDAVNPENWEFLGGDGINFLGDVYQKTSAVDGFNKNNMAYFSDLFANMEKVYQHLQMLLFIVVGGFYLSSIGANKLQVYLENRGESASNQPYLHKFYIPLIMVGTFFMPIPEANGLAHSTICQNVIRYFTTESTKIADMASAIGGKTYMEKIYKQSGGINADGINSLFNQYKINDYKATQGENVYKQTCSLRYADQIRTSKNMLGLTKMTDEQKKEYSAKVELDRNNAAGKKYDITLEACIFLEQEINEAKNENKKLKEMLKGINEFYTNNEAYNRINRLDGYFAIRENQLGWLNSLLTPSSAILAEIITFEDYRINKNDMETSTKQNIENNKIAQKQKDVDVTDTEESINEGLTSFVAGRLVWLMLPGAQQVKEFVMTLYDYALLLITILLSKFNGPISIASGALITLTKTPSVYLITSYIIETTFQKIALLVCTTASVIAFVSYLVSLCKYFYISPFVVAFSMATKRMNKIVDFLVSGISIFFKPILIVLFIYLALFVHTLIAEVFLFFSVEQFSGVYSGGFMKGWNPLTIFVANAICGLLGIFGVLASSYIMWKLIVSGPGWALSLVGIDGKHDDMISQGIEQHLARRAFVA